MLHKKQVTLIMTNILASSNMSINNAITVQTSAGSTQRVEQIKCFHRYNNTPKRDKTRNTYFRFPPRGKLVTRHIRYTVPVVFFQMCYLFFYK